MKQRAVTVGFVWCTLTAVLAVSDGVTPARVVVVAGFLLFVPGFAVSGGVTLDDWKTLFTLAVGLSITLDMFVAQGLVWVGAWSAERAMVVLLAVSIAGLSLQSVRRRDRIRTVEPDGAQNPGRP